EDIADYFALAELGRLVILQNLLLDDLEFGEALLETAYRADIGGKLPKYITRVLVQHYISLGKTQRASDLLDEVETLDLEDYSYLRAELLNPYTLGDPVTGDEWLGLFNRVFVENGISEVQLDTRTNLVPFERLSATSDYNALTDESIVDQELVSVVLTAFRPAAEGLRTSIFSILNQSWQNIELIIVDDSSGPEYDHLYTELSEIDERVHVIKLPENQGTYNARNIGYQAATGIYITGQDDDDWSHPERIAHQVK